MTTPLSAPDIAPHVAGPDGLGSTDPIAVWSMGGTLATAVFTLLLAIFAYLAWRASADSLASMQRQEEDNRKSVARQIEDQSWGRQMDALNRYLVLLYELRERKPLGPNVGVTDVVGPTGRSSLQYSWAEHQRQLEDRRRLEREVRSAGGIWRLQHRLPEATRQCLEGAEGLLIDAQPTEHQPTEYRDSWVEGVSRMIQGVQDSQTFVAEAEKEKHAKALFRSVTEAIGLPKAHPADYGDTGKSVMGRS